MALSLARQTEVFVRGFAATKSFTYPYIVERYRGLWVMRDAPHERSYERHQELVACGMEPAVALKALRSFRFSRGAFCTMEGHRADLDAVRDTCKAAGMRLRARQPLFLADPADAPRLRGPLKTVRITDEGQAAEIANLARARQVLSEHLGRDDSFRLYAAFDGRLPVGWVTSVPVGRDNWVSNLYVDPDYRGQRIGRALMSKMLRDDHKYGVRASVLLASQAGARLYPHVGYRRTGTLLVFAPGPKWR